MALRMKVNIFVGGSNKLQINPDAISVTLSQIGISPKDVNTIICGLEHGPEKAGEIWARKNRIALDEHRPHLEKYGQIAWVIRNKVIMAHADMMLVYWDGKSAGARNLMNSGVKKGLKVYKIQVDDGRISEPVLWDRIVPEEEWGWTSEW
jgi:hypothetical protein